MTRNSVLLESRPLLGVSAATGNLAESRALLGIAVAADNWMDIETNHALINALVAQFMHRLNGSDPVNRVVRVFNDFSLGLPDQLEALKDLFVFSDEVSGIYRDEDQVKQEIRILMQWALRSFKTTQYCEFPHGVNLQLETMRGHNDDKLHACMENIVGNSYCWNSLGGGGYKAILVSQKVENKDLRKKSAKAVAALALMAAVLWFASIDVAAEAFFGMAALLVIVYGVGCCVNAALKLCAEKELIDKQSRREITMTVVNDVLSVRKQCFFSGGAYTKRHSKSERVKYHLAFELSQDRFKLQYPNMTNDALEREYYEQLNRLQPEVRCKILHVALQEKLYQKKFGRDRIPAMDDLESEPYVLMDDDPSAVGLRSEPYVLIDDNGQSFFGQSAGVPPAYQLMDSNNPPGYISDSDDVVQSPGEAPINSPAWAHSC